MAMSHLTLLAFLICFLFTSELLQTFRIKLIPMDRFDVTLFPENLTLDERYQGISKISQAHVYHFESMVSTSSIVQKESLQHNPTALQPSVEMGNRYYYLTTLSVGTRPYSPYLVVDTGSVDTWMQCEGCNPCFFNREGNFNRSQSQSYLPLRCTDPLCNPHLCENTFCMYEHRCLGSRLGDCYSIGQVGLDTFTFDNRGSLKRFPHSVFGCGLKNDGLEWGKSGQTNNIAGIFGLGLGRRSIFMQYINETKNHLSYCLPPLGHPHAFTYLLFGDDASFDTKRFKHTKLIRNVTQYAVKVVDISINKRRLKIKPSVFEMRQDKTGGFILDSGVPHTVLVRPAYIKVKQAIVEYFRTHYNWHPLPPQQDQLDLCYSLPHRNFTAPNMTYHFTEEKTILDLPSKNVFQYLNASLCLMVMPINEPGTSRLGALQQSDFRFFFDFASSKVYFAPEICGPF